MLNVGALLAVLAALSLLFKAESIRGAGRVISGFALLAIGVALISLTPEAMYAALAVTSSGVLTVASGARKYLRRNLPQ